VKKSVDGMSCCCEGVVLIENGRRTNGVVLLEVVGRDVKNVNVVEEGHRVFGG